MSGADGRWTGANDPDDPLCDMDAVRACEALRDELDGAQLAALEAGTVGRCTEGLLFPDGSIIATRDRGQTGAPLAVLS